MPVMTDPLGRAGRAIFLLLCLMLSACTDSAEKRFQDLNRQGIAYFARREYREALAAWEKARKLNPADASVPISIGNAYLKLAALRPAVDSFAEAVKLVPGRLDIECEYVRLLILSGDIAAAEARLQKVQKLSPNWPQAQILQGDLYLFKHRPELAETSYKRAAAYTEFSQLALMKLAQTYLIRDNVEAARKTYQMVADTRPTDVPVLLQMHHYWKLKDDWQQAETFLTQVAAKEPENLSHRWALAQFHFEQGRYEAAQTDMEAVLSKNPENLTAAVFLIEIRMARGQFKIAETELESLSAQYNQDPGIAVLQGKLNLLLNAPIMAVECFKRALSINPSLTIAHYLLGVSYMSSSRFHLARLSLSEALKQDPFYTDAELLMADLYYEQGEFDLALIHAGRVAEREKESYRANLLLGHIYQAAGQYDKAGLSYVNAEKLHSASLAAVYYRAVAAEKTGQLQTALSLYEKVLSTAPGLADAALRYGRLLIQTGRVHKALQYFERAVQADAKNAYLRYVMGEVYLAADQGLKGAKAFQKAVALSPELISAYDQLALLAEAAGNDQAYQQWLVACIENNPKYAPAYLRLAQFYHRQWRSDKAVAILEQGLSHNAGDVWLSNSLAWIYLEQGQQLDKALVLAQAAYEKLPEAAAVLDTLGWAYYQKGLYDQALWYLQEAVSKAPKNDIVLYHLGSARYTTGDMAAAENHLKQALALNLKNPYKDQAESLLKKMCEPVQDTPESRWQPKAFDILEGKDPAEDLSEIVDSLRQQKPGDSSAEDVNPEGGKDTIGSENADSFH